MLDEEYINRSLLDSLDAQADAEPISSSSDSDAPIATASSFQTSASSNSTNTIFPSYLKSAPHHPESYNPSSQNTTNNSSQSMYNGMSNISTLQSEFSIPSAEHDSLNQHKLNGFGSAPSFRNSATFQPFSHPRQRSSNPPYRDTTNFTAQPYATQPDIFIPNMPHIPSQSQQQPPHPFDTIHPPRQFDFSLGGSQPTSSIVANGQVKPGPFDSYRIGMDSTLSQSHLGKQQNPNTGPPGLRDTQQGQLPHQAQNPSQGFQGAHHGVNGISAHVHGHHGPMGQNQIPFGPSLQAVGGGSIPLTNSVSQGNGVGAPTGPASMTHLGGPSQNPQQQQQEEISTIFVVGFPDDMQEREFQNMFTFSPGFEAATLKIPNKDLTAYGTPGGIPGVAARAAGLPLHYAGSNDPYNLVTVNQGGVVVDGGRDGLTSSWPAPQMQAGQEDGSHFMNGGNIAMQPPRKQIIGFAKFRTRQEALEARDTLQGRRVDIEKGSVLKAEMAKKNLHTKRGPGVVPLGSLAGVGGVNAAEAIAGLNGLGGMSSTLGGPTGEAPFIQREKELGVMGAMGIAGLSQRRDRLGSSAPGPNGEIREDDDRQQQPQRVGVVGHAGLSFGPRGARERAEEEERKRKEKEAVRLRQNSYAFEAFHSVPHQMVHEGANSLLSAENGTMDFGASHSSGGLQQGLVSPTDTTFNNIPACSGASGGPAVGPWGMLREVSASAALRKQSAPVLSQSNHFRSTSPPPPQGTSPPSRDTVPSPTSGLNSSPSNGSILPSSITAPFSPQSNSSSLPGQVSSSESPQPLSPASEPTPQGEAASASHGKASISNSSCSSVSGYGDELSRAVGPLAVSTSQGTVSPQLPSPASGASSGTGRNPGDQNPPINTLYVGNLPTAPIPGGSSNYLEDRLRDLFSKQRGYRKLCFRQKSNGPMCFVEFEDVSFAAQAMRDLYGHTLDGLIRNGGIRLSYSKNPLGVRTPTNGNTATSFQQQQQSQSQNNQLPPLGAGHPFFTDSFHQRIGEMDTIRSSRRDTTSSGVTSPTSSSSSYHYTMSSQPPRFFSASPPTSSPFGAPSFSSISPNLPAAFPRANPLNTQGFGFFSHLGSSTNAGIPSSSTSSSSFSPFGSIISAPTSASNTSSSALHSHSAHASSIAMIPDQPSADPTIPPANIATATT